jgi:hypothetical protein
MQVATTNKVTLLPVQSAPLPHHFRFDVHAVGIPKQNVVILPAANPNVCWSLMDQETLEPCGFSKLTRQLFQYAEQQGLWGKTIQVRANYALTNGVVVHANQSASQPLQLPLKPILINSPNKIDGVASKGSGAFSPQGLRLFWAALPNNLTHNAWFVGADNRLSAVAGVPAFDCYSFWISALLLPIKSSAGINTGDAFATLIRATRLPPGFGSLQATVAQITAAAGANAWTFESCIFWNATRLLFYAPNSGVPTLREFTPGGLQLLTLQQFAASQSPNDLWKLGLYPKPIAASGLASVV